MNGSKLGVTCAAGPPTIFPWVPNSCLSKLIVLVDPPKMLFHTQENQRKNKEKRTRLALQVFEKEVGKMFKYFKVFHVEDDLTLSLTDKIGRKVKQFLNLKKSKITFWISFLGAGRKRWCLKYQKEKFDLQKNSLISKWLQKYMRLF